MILKSLNVNLQYKFSKITKFVEIVKSVYPKVKRDNKFMEIVRGIRFRKYLEEEAKKERNQLAESSEESKRNKKERTTSEKLQEVLEPLSYCPMSDD